ncbi:hypothetical protein I316_05600 [Kwoniella heveanensis BCC8398]|uniref:Sulfatase N-terminal domain-containing protein n=1 Tax=Kwoniella heveanensis BCC8398 TaxID=1296120 RepID=A0A1B9GNK8_9TREE|nr:hypothetical protein I316_05600 [Kwoniella heveanensis BCC8398]
MASTNKQPNLLFIIADDLGFSDIGCYGGEIATPNIDRLAGDGVRMLNYHTAAACSPTRAMLLSGTDAHIGGLGCLIEYKASERGAKRWNGKAGYEGYLNQEIAALPEVLSDNGYHTILSGKWHLGMRQDAGPWARGFQKSFTMLPGCCNHYGWEPVLENGGTGMPYGGRPIHAEDGVHVKVPANKNENPDGFYSSDTYATKMIQYLNGRTDEQRAMPFFGYLAYTAPHWPLQCAKAVRDKYRGMYDDGPHALRERRLAKLVDMGILKVDVVPHEMIAPEVSEWDGMTGYERQCSSRAMEAYAGMVEQMDTSIGRVIDHLKQIGEYENTMIVFMSDNGAEGAAIAVMGPKVQEAIHQYFDNSLENIGAWNSYTWLGPMWAQASTAPSRLYKTFPSEGGILVPCVVKLPEGQAYENKPWWQKGGFNRSFSTCMDLYPTFLDMIGVSLPAEADKVVHRGRRVHAPRGQSWKAFISNGRRAEASHKQQEPVDEEFALWPSDMAIGWELHEQAALKKGQYKIVYLKQSHGGKAVNGGDELTGWELFNVTADPGETFDLSEKEPEKLQELLDDWDAYVKETGLVWGPTAMEPGLSKEEAPGLHDSDYELQGTWLQTPNGQKPTI